jgi:hypothetical protein
MGCKASVSKVGSDGATLIKREFLRADIKADNKNKFSLLTWNLLVRELVDAFPRADKAHFPWEYRKQLVE